MTDLLSLAVALICLGAIYSKAHPDRRALGSAGLPGDRCRCAGGDRRQLIRERAAAGGIVVALLVGFLMLVAHVALMVYRSKTGNMTPQAIYRLGAAGRGDDDHPATMTDPAELQARLSKAVLPRD